MKSDKLLGNQGTLNGLYNIYIHFFNILDKEDSQLTSLILELEEALKLSEVTELSLHNVDIVFVKLLSDGFSAGQNLEFTKQNVRLFAMIKWFYKNNRKVLIESKLYNTLCKSSRDTIVIESESETHERLRLILKSIDAEPKFIEEMLEKVQILPSYHNVIVTLWATLRTVKGAEAKRQLGKVLKTEEMCCIIQALFDKFCHVDIFNGFQITLDFDELINAITLMLLEVTEDHSEYISDINLVIQSKTGASLDELLRINKDLRTKYKELRLLKYEEEKETNPDRGKEELVIYNPEEEANEKVYKIDFKLSLQQKKELLSTAKFLFLKSDAIQIVSVMDNVRMESISTISSETLKLDFDAIVILTKGITHGEVFRVRSLCGDTPIIFTSRTNRRLIIEDIYNQF